MSEVHVCVSACILIILLQNFIFRKLRLNNIWFLLKMSLYADSALSQFWIAVLIFSFKINQSISFGLRAQSLIRSRSDHTRRYVNSSILGKDQTTVLTCFWKFLSWIPAHLLITNTSWLSFLCKSFVWTYLACVSQSIFFSLNLFTIWSVFTTCYRWQYIGYIYLLSVHCFYHIYWIKILLGNDANETWCHFIWRAFLFDRWLSRSWHIVLNVFLNLILQLLLLKLIKLLDILNYLFFLIRANSFQTIA